MFLYSTSTFRTLPSVPGYVLETLPIFEYFEYFASRRLTQSTVLNSSFIELSLGVVAFKIQWCLTVLLTSKS